MSTRSKKQRATPGKSDVFGPRVVLSGDCIIAQTLQSLIKRNKIRYFTVYSNGLITQATHGYDEPKRVKWLSTTESVQQQTCVEAFGSTTEALEDKVIKLTSYRPRNTFWIVSPDATADAWYKAIDLGFQSSEKFKSLQAQAKSAQAPPSKPLYEDDCVTLFQDRVEVKWYTFPIATRKTIYVRDIKEVYVPEIGILNHKSWGMGMDFSVWWACATTIAAGLRPGDSEPRVVIDHASWPAVGFSTRDRTTFMELLKQLVTK
eukprot:m.30528 g.30528  ORF g.30528 m.30528 type:complete len:261 (-) comp16301_c0_seq1:477-1259(-)